MYRKLTLILLVLSISLLSCSKPDPALTENIQSETAPSEVVQKEFVKVKPVPPPSLAEKHAFVSTAMNTDINYHLYLPTSYDTETHVQFPVVYWLHGSGGFPPGVINMLSKRFHSAIKAGKIPPVIVVFPDGQGQSMWLDSKDGKVPMEHVVIQELVPHIDSKLRTVASARGRIIEGGSMGGYGAARFGFKYPQMFGAISMLNPGPMQEVLDPNDAPIVGAAGAQAVLDRVFSNDLDYFRSQSPWVLAESYAANQDRVLMRMIIGEMDPTVETNRGFSARLTDLGIPHTLRVLPGVNHSPRTLFPALGDSYWEFFRLFLLESEDS